MDKGQILRDYKAAKNHKRQIPILADLNACDKERIVAILTEGGYKMIYNTNGVDISVKAEEIKSRYESGESVAVLSKAYYVSQKAMRALLDVEETEETSGMEKSTEKETIDQMADMINKLTADKEHLQESLNKAEAKLDSTQHELNCVRAERQSEIDCLRTENEKLRKELSDCKEQCDNDKYQQLCIKNSQLNATIDVLIEKIQLLKVVRGI